MVTGSEAVSEPQNPWAVCMKVPASPDGLLINNNVLINNNKQ